MKTNIGVFFGGRSTEHEISVISASQAMHAINRDKYDVTPIYISIIKRNFGTPGRMPVVFSWVLSLEPFSCIGALRNITDGPQLVLFSTCLE